MSLAEIEGVDRLSRDLAKACATLGRDEARFLVDAYYQMQERRIRSANQVRSLEENEEPHAVLVWLHEQSGVMERQMKLALQKYAEADPVGEWSLSICGIGPVLAAGLLAHIDITRANTVGKIWRFAGLDHTVKWEKGKKRPWNAALKTLCWKIGESFVKTSTSERQVYGGVYRERKAYEQAKNEAGDYADQAEAIIKARPSHAQAKTYKQGKLPDGHIHARAQRYTVKLFLAHWHHVAYESWHEAEPPLPWIIQHGGHTDFIKPPNWPMEK